MSKGVESAEETTGSKARGKLSKKSTEPFEKTHGKSKCFILINGKCKSFDFCQKKKQKMRAKIKPKDWKS